MTPTAESHGWKFSMMAFFVATVVHALGTGWLLSPSSSVVSDVLAWLWCPLPMAIVLFPRLSLETGSIFVILFSWSLVVGCGFGFLVPLKRRFFPRKPRAPKPPGQNPRYDY